MFQGLFFSSGDDRLDLYVQELDGRLAAEFPEFVDGSAARRVRLCPDEYTGRGAEIAAGVVTTKDMPLAPYAGRVVLDWPPSDYVLELSCFRRAGRQWHPCIVAGPLCRMADPDPLNAALFNHSCQESSVRLRRPAGLLGCALPCAVAFAPAGLTEGCPLTWDYDGGLRSGNGAFTVDRARSLELRLAGVDTVPCACRRSLPCPRDRWFRVAPDV